MAALRVAVLCALLGAVAACAAAAAAAGNSGTNWAVLIAGSNGYDNYRHQADICHAYQLLHKNGIPDSQMIVMMYDDIAHNDENPVKGNIINKPKGPNVYPGVPKDYTGDDVTAKNFLAVLTGDSSAVNGVGSGRVLKSGPNDNVFVFFADHGGPGLIAMPNPPYLYQHDLTAALQTMNSKSMYKRLVFYLEACESGSMFYQNYLPANINIYATTAANPFQSSYATYYDSTRNTYLGDLYSVNWMEDSDASDISTETLQTQYTKVAKVTNLSQVMQYGQMNIANDTVADYQAFDKFLPAAVSRAARTLRDAHDDAVDARDVRLEVLKRAVLHAQGADAMRKAEARLQAEYADRARWDAVFAAVVEHVAAAEHVEQLQTSRAQQFDSRCIQQFIETFETECGRLSDYALGKAFVFNNLCQHGVHYKSFARAVQRVC